ncbi:unnamed protein product [Bursaphelenchus okinawaensis]|uniref:Uncharacterized protein n=1 Tax=Bursaphelenchus okinawaensis TaxID=465554 RepID=A0A811JRX1_9BILA|nr:unnamed protein product [Bursaphelenchus okinawaensis]CAG9080069.1 unnamed protein product [Bursaphelenchus okinawaensis]
MLKLLVTAILIPLCSSNYISELENEVTIDEIGTFNNFQRFVELNGKKYKTVEEARERYAIYKTNLIQAQLHQQHEQGTAEFGETKFMDLTSEEYEKQILSEIKNNPLKASRKLTEAELKQYDVSDIEAFDWRDKGYVNPVKDQGSCGSCWAFSVVGNIEGQWKRKTGQLERLSEQELVDCDWKDFACKGGEMDWAYGEIIRIGGLVSEKDYEYVGEKCFCRVDEYPFVAYINGSLHLPDSENVIKNYLYYNGPLSIGLNAKTLQYYKKGIHHPWAVFCKPDINHAVLLVGFGVEKGNPYWILKNSWGDWWGEDGYFRLYRGKNVCGISQYATSAIIH